MIIQVGVLCKWASDGQRFLLEHFDTIYDSPSHIYHSALPLCPTSSWLHKSYSAELSQEVKVVKGLPAGWGTCSRTVSLGSRALDLSYWNNTIAVGSVGGDIIILDAITGSQMAVLSEHTGEVNALTFSSDGKSLVSGSDDMTVKLWDVQTGGVVKTFHGHTEQVWSVSISADHARIASGSEDNTIHLWDIQTGECHCIIEQQDLVRYINFSPTAPQHLLFVCDGTIQQWNINGHQVGPTCDGSHAAFSSDGNQFVSCKGSAVTVQNSSSGAILAEFHAFDDVQYCCFSPDGRLVAVAAGWTAYVWDITSSKPHLVETFTGHTSYINSLAFSSSSLVSASDDQSVKFWQIGAPDPVVTDLKSPPPTSAVIKFITLQVNDGIIITGDSDGVVKIWDISTGLWKSSFQAPAKIKRDVQLINGRLILVWYEDEKINIWDIEKGELLLAVERPQWYVMDLRISGDGSRVFCLDRGSIQAWSVQTGEVVGETGIDYVSSVRSLTVDGTRVWAHYPNSKYQGWDFRTPGSIPVQLPNMTMPYLNNMLVWDTNESRIRDTVTGKVVFQLPRRFGKLNHIQWIGCYFAACYDSTEVLILDLKQMYPSSSSM